MRPVAVLMMLLAGILLSGCFGNDNPYSNFSVGKVDETGSDAPAAILIGDPQIVTRESLINDRLRETRHLEDLIDDSRTVEFTPQLARDLQLVQSFAARLGISFSPGSVAGFERAEELADLKQEVEVFKLRSELNRLRELAQTDPTNAAFASNGNPQGSTIPEPTVEGIQKLLSEAIAAADAALAEALKRGLAGGNLRNASVSQSPEDAFQDLDAYRAMLRQRESEVRLDDSHDLNGNTLYRLQFQATVLPGAVKNKYGVLDAEVLSAAPTIEQLDDLYEGLLLYLTLRGIEDPGIYSSFRWQKMESDLIADKILERFIIESGFASPDGTAREIVFYVPTGTRDQLYALMDGQDLEFAPRVFRALSIMEVALSSASERSNGLKSESVTDFQEYLMNAIKDRNISFVSEDYKKELDAFAGACADYNVMDGFADQTRAPAAPCAFVRALVEIAGSAGSNGVAAQHYALWKGQAYTYQARPAFRAQRLSSVSSAVNSMQTAFSLAASIPSSGVGIDAGAGAARTATGTAEAIERSPLVVGYSDRSSGDEPPRFGFVFGPPAILNPETNTLEYRHLPASYPVYADISIPGWWPAAGLRVRSVWAANWHTGHHALSELAPGQRFDIRLPANRSVIIALLDYLAGRSKLITPPQATARGVWPDKVSACATLITFHIEGENLWRNPAVTLRGIDPVQVNVLPDMNGLSVQYNISDLPPEPANDIGRSVFQIRTTAGTASSDSVAVEIVDPPAGYRCDGQGGLTRASSALPTSSAVRTTATRVIAGSKVDLEFDWNPSLSAIAGGPPKAYMQLVIPGFSQQAPVESGGITYQSPSVLETSVTLAKPNGISSLALNGATVRTGVVYSPSDGGQKVYLPAEKQLVFYVDEPAAKLRSVAIGLPDLPGTVDLAIPNNFAKAFPNANLLADGGYAATVTISGTKYELGTTPALSGGALRLTLSTGDLDSAAITAIKAAQCKADVAVVLATTDAMGSDRPEIAATVKLEKRTTGC